MKSNYFILLIAATFFIFSFTGIGKKQTHNTALIETVDVGTIKQSILKPLIFNKNQMGNWVPLQGQELSENSELFKILKENSELNILTKKEGKYYLPDARGKFIRASNINGKGMDPDTNRLVGSHQADELKKHNHPLNLTGRDRDGSNCRSSLNGCGQNSVPANKNSGNTGGVETRPVNISMYTYIKVSN